ncbi:squalene synthase HpnC [Acidiferrimicrobium sp. IK]|uniref:squalene synthase HpnC n=1 Tax=Acidiferrimicrobium sp. IK TaxID=2871700 RepID=UPI0021CAF1FA|nr:squalene synthase HpnC [Acidiferrimicrobium sp. IK]MCU4184534.1 squalene synthase HpnC [Acidiferrimicrobium sp. IK]
MIDSPPTASPLPARPAGLPDGAQVLGRASGENFTVASRLLAAGARDDLMAFYGYARLVDQIGDAYDGDRLAALDWVDAQLSAALADPDRAGLEPLVARAAGALTRLGADPAPLRDLVAANRQDQVVTSYRSFDDLAGYCALSADPIGRLVLAAFGAVTPQRVAWSDRICTALQLAEHWQDVAEDHAAGRVYIPAEDLARFGVDPAELSATAAPAGPALRGLLAFEAARARRLLEEGTPLVASLRGRARLAVAGFVAGGHAALDALAGAGFDPLQGPPRPKATAVAVRTARLLLGARS